MPQFAGTPYGKSKRIENVVACLDAKEIFERDIL